MLIFVFFPLKLLMWRERLEYVASRHGGSPPQTWVSFPVAPCGYIVLGQDFMLREALSQSQATGDRQQAREKSVLL